MTQNTAEGCLVIIANVIKLALFAGAVCTAVHFIVKFW